MKNTIDKSISGPNLKQLQKNHANKWVGFSPDYKKLVATANTLEGVFKKAKSEKIVVMKVLPAGVGYAPSFFLNA